MLVVWVALYAVLVGAISARRLNPQKLTLLAVVAHEYLEDMSTFGHKNQVGMAAAVLRSMALENPLIVI